MQQAGMFDQISLEAGATRVRDVLSEGSKHGTKCEHEDRRSGAIAVVDFPLVPDVW